MDLGTFKRIAITSLARDRYVLIQYNGTSRNILPISYRKSFQGWRVHAWCSLHPSIPSESFLMSKIGSADISNDQIQYISFLENEIDYFMEKAQLKAEADQAEREKAARDEEKAAEAMARAEAAQEGLYQQSQEY